MLISTGNFDLRRWWISGIIYGPVCLGIGPPWMEDKPYQGEAGSEVTVNKKQVFMEDTK